MKLFYVSLQDGNTVIVDPGLKEEAAMQGRVTIMVNPNKEVCAVHKAGGIGLSSSQIFRYVDLYVSTLSFSLMNTYQYFQGLLIVVV